MFIALFVFLCLLAKHQQIPCTVQKADARRLRAQLHRLFQVMWVHAGAERHILPVAGPGSLCPCAVITTCVAAQSTRSPDSFCRLIFPSDWLAYDHECQHI